MTASFADFDATMRQSASAPADRDRELTSMELAVAVDRIIHEIIPKLSDDQKWKLRCALPAPASIDENSEAAYGANFSIANEIDLQVKALRALREHYLPEGRLRDGVSPKEFKDFLSTTNQMVKMLISSHEEVMNMERNRLVEASTVDILKEMADPKLVKALGYDPCAMFLEKLEQKLEMIE